MRLIRLVLPIVAVAFAAALMPAAATANALPYPPEQADAVVDDGTIVSGETVTVDGTGFLPGERVDYTVRYVAQGMAVGPRAVRALPQAFELSQRAAASVIADENGNFTVVIELERVGTAIITFVGAESGRSASVTVEVLAAGDGDGFGLARTGTDGDTYWQVVLTGVGAVVVGALLLTFTMRRRRASQTLVG